MRPAPPAVAALGALALALAACSGGDGGPGPTAGQSTEGAGTGSGGDSPSSSSSTSSTSTNTGKPFDPEEFTDRLETAIEKDPTARIDLEIEVDGSVAISAEGVQDLSEEALDMDVRLGDQTLGYLLVDGEYYLAQPPKWVPVSRDSDNEVVRQTLDQIQVLSMRNQFDAFVAGVEDAGIKGTEQVDGVSTTHYTATVDTTRLMSELEVDKDESVPDSVVYDVWLDSRDLIRKISFEVNGATTTLTATDWGEPLDIEAPKPSELAEAPEAGTP